MANVVERAGSINVRIGGSSQDTATLVDSLPGDSTASAQLDTISSVNANHLQPGLLPNALLC
jgi:hypothetical protein